MPDALCRDTETDHTAGRREQRTWFRQPLARGNCPLVGTVLRTALVQRTRRVDSR